MTHSNKNISNAKEAENLIDGEIFVEALALCAIDIHFFENNMDNILEKVDYNFLKIINIKYFVI